MACLKFNIQLEYKFDTKKKLTSNFRFEIEEKTKQKRKVKGFTRCWAAPSQFGPLTWHLSSPVVSRLPCSPPCV